MELPNNDKETASLCLMIVKARQAGLKEVLYKPFRLDQLLETVERVLVEIDVSPSTG